MPRPLEPVERAAFFGECTSAQRALSNLFIARSRIMHRNKYETNYAPNVPYIKNTNRKHNTE